MGSSESHYYLDVPRVDLQSEIYNPFHSDLVSCAGFLMLN